LNRVFNSLHGGSLENTFTVPLIEITLGHILLFILRGDKAFSFTEEGFRGGGGD